MSDDVPVSAPAPSTPEHLRQSQGRMLVLFGAIFLAAVFTRFWDLGSRPLHHDESIHAFQSLSLAKGGDWRYDPAYHGPFLYYANALVYKIVGATNTTARLMPAVFGLILIAFAIPLRRWIGNTAALAYALAILTSGHMTYFSRFIREDLYSLVFTLGTIVAFQRFLETDRAKWLSLSAAAFAFAGVTKENAYMTGVLFVAYGVWCLAAEALMARREGGSVGKPFEATARWIAEHALPIASAGILFLVIWVTMYTGFGKHSEDWWTTIPKAVKYWMGQHSIARIPGPWYYYFPQIAYYETAIAIAAFFAFPWTAWRRDPFLRSLLVAIPSLTLYGVARASLHALSGHAIVWILGIFAIATWVAIGSLRPAPERILTPFLRFMAFWTVASLGIYAWAREKVPWLTVHPLLPLTILAAVGFARLWQDRRRAVARVALAVIALTLAVNIGGMYLASFRYGAHDVEREPKHAEMLAYVQTSRDLIRALDVVNRAKDRVPAGQPVITAGGEASWPLTWYLRDVQTNWATRIENATTPIIVADWDPEGGLEKQLAPQYDFKRVPIRAWWFPEPHTEAGVFHPTVKEFLRWWLFHEIWSPIGSQDTVFYVRKDLASGTGPLAALNLQIQDMTSRDYPADADALPAGRSWGSVGSGPGQLAEPRGVAVDARGYVYVADTKNSRISIFDGNGAFQRVLGSKGAAEGQLNEPCGVAVGPDGTVYVADTWNHRIARFGPGGEPLPPWVDPDKTFFGPRSVVLVQGNLYVADTGNKRIVRLDGGGKVTGSWGTAGAEPGQFVEPVGLAADAAGHVYVADTGNHRVQVFDADGKFIRQIRIFGWKDFYTEPYLVAAPGDAVIVTDAWKGRLGYYDAAGNLIHSYQYPEMKRPTGITLDPFGRILVTDRETGKLFSWGLADLVK